MLKLFFIALGGALGALSRFGVVFLVSKFFPGEFPVGTLIVNTLGSFLVAFLTRHFFYSAIDPVYRYLFITGFLGAFTTFSTFSFETISLWQKGYYFFSMLNIFLNLSLGFVGVFFGFFIANLLFLK